MRHWMLIIIYLVLAAAIMLTLADRWRFAFEGLLIIISVFFAIHSRRQLLRQRIELSDYRRMLAADARCIFWEAQVRGLEGWRRPTVSADTAVFDWSIRPLDREAVELVLGKDYDDREFQTLWSKAIVPEDLQECHRRFQQAVLSGQRRLTRIFRLRDHGGNTRWYMEDLRINPDADSHWCCTGVCVDITDRKDAEEAVKESERHLRQLLLKAKSLFFEIEAEAEPEQAANPQPGLLKWTLPPLDAETVQNLLPLEVPTDGQFHFGDIIDQRHPDDVDRTNRTFVDAITRHADSYTQEYRLRNRFGSFGWFSETIYLTYVSPRKWRLAGILQDISARKQAEESLQDVMRQADCIVFYGTLRTGEDTTDTAQQAWELSVADVDAAQRVMPLTLTNAQPYVQAWHLAIVPEDRIAWTQRKLGALRDDTRRLSQSFRVRDMHGNIHWISEDVRFELIEARTYRVVSVCVDITSQKLVEEALGRARLAAEEANSAKTAFLANMSHEIRTPMTAIIGYTDLLTESITPTDRLSYARTIHRNCEHLMTVLDDILDLSRIESGKLPIHAVPCSPVQIAEDVASMLRPKALEKGLELSIEVEHGVPRQILSDPVRFRQILVNLVSNALKFTDDGSVTMRVYPQAEPGRDPMLLVDVTDTGIGITADQIPLLFRPFQQGDLSHRRRFGGTGLGLAISRRLAHLLGGDVTVISEAARGSTFTVKLSGKPVKQPAPNLAEPLAPPSRLDGIRVLLAEDAADTRRLVCIHLRRLGCTCVAVENGQEAFNAAMESQSTGKHFDVVLMDMQMPVLDGYSASRMLRQGGYPRAIIALTAHAMEGDRELCLKTGCDDYVIKPIDIANLASIIAKYAGRRAAAATQ